MHSFPHSTRFVLHLGYPKTGTTTIQRSLFARHPEVSYLGRPFDRELLELEHTVLTAGDSEFSKRRPELVGRLFDRIESAPRSTVVFSHEGFLRATRHGGHDLMRTLPRIEAVFGEAARAAGSLLVLVSLRNPVEYVFSHFVQFVRGDQADLDAHVRDLLEGVETPFFESVRYDRVLARLHDLFGDQLEVRLFEDLKADATAYARTLCESIGIDAEVGAQLVDGQHRKQKQKSDKGYWVERRSGPVHSFGALITGLGMRQLGRAIKMRAGHHVVLSSDQQQAMGDYFRSMNRAVSERFGLPLEAAGYDV